MTAIHRPARRVAQKWGAPHNRYAAPPRRGLSWGCCAAQRGASPLTTCQIVIWL